MNVVYHEKAKQWGEGYALMKQATERLQKALVDSPDPVEAEWDGGEDEQGHSAYTLALRDFAGEVKASFTPQELMQPNELFFRVYGLLISLLRGRDRKLRQQMHETSGGEK